VVLRFPSVQDHLQIHEYNYGTDTWKLSPAASRIMPSRLWLYLGYHFSQGQQQLKSLEDLPEDLGHDSLRR